jgi:hypothetical protein
LSNFMVLSSMIAVLALSAVVMQVIRGESAQIDIWHCSRRFSHRAAGHARDLGAGRVLRVHAHPARRILATCSIFFLWVVPLATALQIKGAPDLYGARTDQREHESRGGRESGPGRGGRRLLVQHGRRLS